MGDPYRRDPYKGDPHRRDAYSTRSHSPTFTWGGWAATEKVLLWCLPDLPNTFSYVYGVFSRSGSPKSTFSTFGPSGAVRTAMRVRWVGGQTDGHLDPGTGSPSAGPGAATGPARRWGWALLKSYPVCGSASIPPHSNIQPCLKPVLNENRLQSFRKPTAWFLKTSIP